MLIYDCSACKCAANKMQLGQHVLKILPRVNEAMLPDNCQVIGNSPKEGAVHAIIHLDQHVSKNSPRMNGLTQAIWQKEGEVHAVNDL